MDKICDDASGVLTYNSWADALAKAMNAPNVWDSLDKPRYDENGVKITTLWDIGFMLGKGAWVEH